MGDANLEERKARHAVRKAAGMSTKMPPRAKKGGRPTKLTDDLIARISQFLRVGVYLETAAAAVGIHKDTLFDWLKKGSKRPKSIHGRFSDSVLKAQAEADMTDLMLIRKAARAGSWQAAAWRQERKHPNQWARTERLQVSGADGGPMKVEHSSASMIAKLKRLAGEDDDSNGKGDNGGGSPASVA